MDAVLTLFKAYYYRLKFTQKLTKVLSSEAYFSGHIVCHKQVKIQMQKYSTNIE